MQDHGMCISGDSPSSSSDGVRWIAVETHITPERRALARELHDTVVQPLTSLVMSFAYLEHFPQGAGQMEANVVLWKELAQEALDSLRRTLAGLHTSPHIQSNLPEALGRCLVPQLCSRGIRLVVEPHNWPEDLPIDWTSNLYLVVREALTNTEKHAHASMVIVVLCADTKELSISITDNGLGFRADDLVLASRQDQLGSGLGISGMRARVQMLGGTLDLMTAPGCGVRLEIRVPNPNNVQPDMPPSVSFYPFG
jgi:two-component system, NarL family, sensor histidine kinase LiaS